MDHTVSDGPRPHPVFPAGFVGSFRSTDFDEVAAAARGWNQHYTKLGPGPFAGELTQAHTPRMQLGDAAWSCGMLSTGRLPAATRTFALTIAQGGPARVSGVPAGTDDVATRSDRDELHFLTPGACRLLVVSAEHGVWDRAAATWFGTGWDALGCTSPVLRLRDADGARLVLQQVIARVGEEPHGLIEPETADAIEQEVALALVSRLDLPAPRLGAAERRRLARRVEDYLLAHRFRPVSIAELCTATDAPARSLHVACRENLGMSPIAYLRALRLNAARRDLRQPEPATTVTDTATKWGFYHFGEFAAAYRRQFGEPPSHTLRRSRSNKAEAVR